MSYEVEVKYRSVDLDQLERRLTEQGAVGGAATEQEDTYLCHPARDFALTNEALRLRRVMDENRITYKGPRLHGPTKTREEIEIGVAGGEHARRGLVRLFERLGFQPVATIRKTRKPFHLAFDGRDIEAALDRALGLGDFIEIETQALSETDLPAAQAAVLTLADQLGLTEVEPRSYLRMALDARRDTIAGLPPVQDVPIFDVGLRRDDPPQAG
jgi:adenylate cyclase class 2